MSSSNKRPRAPHMRREERLQQLLAVARTMVSEGGGASLTMASLAKAAGVAKPVVYSHFTNSSDVIVALLHQHFADSMKFVAESVEGSTTVSEYISRLVDASFKFESSSELPIRKITNGFSADARVNQVYLKYEAEFVEHWGRLLRSCGARGRGISVLSYAFSNMVNNTVYTFALKHDQKIAQETLKNMMLAAIETVAPGARNMTPPSPASLRSKSRAISK